MAKSSRIKVPKRVAGVKIPKAVRKGPVMDFVNSTTGRVLIAQALTAAIGVFAYKHATPETRERIRGKVRQGADGTRASLERNTARLSFAFGEAVTAFRTALGEPGGQNPESAAAALAQELEKVEERVGKKKKKQEKQDWSSSEPVNPH
jgi:hypothetical protein